MGHGDVVRASFSMYSTNLLATTGDTGDPIASQLSTYRKASQDSLDE